MRHLLIGKPKNNLIHINLHYEYVTILLFEEECLVYTYSLKMVIKKKSSKSLIPSSWSLFEVI